MEVNLPAVRPGASRYLVSLVMHSTARQEVTCHLVCYRQWVRDLVGCPHWARHQDFRLTAHFRAHRLPLCLRGALAMCSKVPAWQVTLRWEVSDNRLVAK